jgi:hypothetical protein
MFLYFFKTLLCLFLQKIVMVNFFNLDLKTSILCLYIKKLWAISSFVLDVYLFGSIVRS